MKYPNYGDWCKENVIKTIRKQKIHDAKTYLNNLVFNPYGELYSSGVYDYEVIDILGIINGDIEPSKSLLSAVQHEFAEKYFQLTQEANPEMDMKVIRRNGDYTDLMYKALENMAVDEIKDAIMYALDHGTEEIEGSRIPYAKTNAKNIAKIISSNLVKIEHVHINYVDPNAERENIPIDEFKEYLMHLSQSGIFADTINWRYVDLFDSGNFLIESDLNHNNGYELNLAIEAKNKEDNDKITEILREREE